MFSIEGEYIQLREGAQEIIAAKAAVAEVAAAAAAAPSSYSSSLASVALTPMAQSHRLKKASSHESSSVDSDKVSLIDSADLRTLNLNKHASQFSVLQSQNTNDSSSRVAGGTSNVKIMSKTKDCLELNGSETRHGHSTLLPVGNGPNSDRSDFPQSKGTSNGRTRGNSVGKQQSRYTIDYYTTYIKFPALNRS